MQKLAYNDPERPKILALDLDGTVLHYDGFRGLDEFGEAIHGMREELEVLSEAGVQIVIWTCRQDTAELRRHLKDQQIPFDYINDHPWNGPDDPRKIHADWYVDDKNVEFNGVTERLAERILGHRPWWEDAPEWV